MNNNFKKLLSSVLAISIVSGPMSTLENVVLAGAVNNEVLSRVVEKNVAIDLVDIDTYEEESSGEEAIIDGEDELLEEADEEASLGDRPEASERSKEEPEILIEDEEGLDLEDELEDEIGEERELDLKALREEALSWSLENNDQYNFEEIISLILSGEDRDEIMLSAEKHDAYFGYNAKPLNTIRNFVLNGDMKYLKDVKAYDFSKKLDSESDLKSHIYSMIALNMLGEEYDKDLARENLFESLKNGKVDSKYVSDILAAIDSDDYKDEALEIVRSRLRKDLKIEDLTSLLEALVILGEDIEGEEFQEYFNELLEYRRPGGYSTTKLLDYKKNGEEIKVLKLLLTMENMESIYSGIVKNIDREEPVSKKYELKIDRSKLEFNEFDDIKLDVKTYRNGEDFKFDYDLISEDEDVVVIKKDNKIELVRPGKVEIKAVSSLDKEVFDSVEINIKEIELKSGQAKVKDYVDALYVYYNKTHYEENDGKLSALEYASFKRAGFSTSRWEVEEDYSPGYDLDLQYLGNKARQVEIMLSTGRNPRSYKGRDLVGEIVESLNTGKSYNRDFDFASYPYLLGLVAVNNYNEAYSDNIVDYNDEFILDKIEKAQQDNGGFIERDLKSGLAPRNAALALEAVSKMEGPKAKKIREKTIDYFKSIQKDNGGFFEGAYVTNYNADIVKSLLLSGEDLTSEKWTIAGNNPIESVVYLIREDNSFKDFIGEDMSSINNPHERDLDCKVATQAVLQALVEINKYYPDYLIKTREISQVKEIEEAELKVNTAIIVLDKEGKITKTIEPNEVIINNKKHSGAFTALGSLQATTDNIEMNYGFVESIEGIRNTDKAGWIYSVNGEIPYIAASYKKLEANDKVIWIYMPDEAFEPREDRPWENRVKDEFKLQWEDILDKNSGLEIKDGFYQIGSKEDLVKFQELVNESSDGKINGELLNDIDLEDMEFKPIGKTSSAGFGFSGEFNGNNHTIKNLKIETKEFNTGLFGFNKGLIKNLIVEGEVSSTNRSLGGIAGKNAGTIENVVNKANVTALGTGGRANNIAGIAGESDSGKILRARNYGTIRGLDRVAGIVGFVSGAANLKVGASANFGEIKAGASRGNMAGIVGMVDKNVNLTIYNSYNQAGINIQGGGIGAGIVAKKGNDGNLKIYNSYNTGEIEAEEKYEIVKIPEINEYTGKLKDPNAGQVTSSNNYYLGGETDLEKGFVSEAYINTLDFVDRLNMDIEGIDISKEEKFQLSSKYPSLVYEGLGSGEEDDSSKEKLEELVKKLADYKIRNLDSDRDKNVKDVLNKKIESLGFEDIGIELISVDNASEDVFVDKDGVINYLSIHPSQQKLPVYSKFSECKFKLSLAGESREIQVRTVIGTWDKDKIREIIETEILEELDKRILGSNSSFDNFNKDVELEAKIGSQGYDYLELKLESDRSDIISIEEGGKSEYVDGKMQLSKHKLKLKPVAGPEKVTIKAKLSTVQAKEEIYEKDYEILVRPGSDLEETLEEKMLRLLNENYDEARFKDYVSGEALDFNRVVNDIRILTPRETNIEDYDNYRYYITSSNDEVIKAFKTKNAGKLVVYRPLPSEKAEKLRLTINMEDKETGKTVSKELKEMTVLPLSQSEIDAEIELMDKVKENYFELIKGENESKDKIRENLKWFREVNLEEDGLKFNTHIKDDLNYGITPDALDGWYDKQEWRLFKTSNSQVISHENLLVTRPKEDTKVKIESILTSTIYGKYAEKYPNNEDFKKLYRQPVSVEVTVLGREDKNKAALEVSSLDASKIENGKEFKASVVLKNKGSEDQALVLILGLYDKSNNKLSNYSLTEKVLGSNEELEINAGFLIPKKGEFYSRIFVWDSLEAQNILLDQPIEIE